MPPRVGSGAGEVVDIDTTGLPSSVAETTSAAADVALSTGQASSGATTAAGGPGADALTAAMKAVIAPWLAQTEAIAADFVAGGTHLGERTTATTTELSRTDQDSGAQVDGITAT